MAPPPKYFMSEKDLEETGILLERLNAKEQSPIANPSRKLIFSLFFQYLGGKNWAKLRNWLAQIYGVQEEDFGSTEALRRRVNTQLRKYQIQLSRKGGYGGLYLSAPFELSSVTITKAPVA